MSRGRPGAPTLGRLPPAPQIFVSLVLISAALTVGFWYKVKEFKTKHHYVAAKHARTVATESFFIFWGFLILLSVMVPMAMFIMWVPGAPLLLPARQPAPRGARGARDVTRLPLQGRVHLPGEQRLHQLGHADVLRAERYARQGPQHEPQRPAGPGGVHLLGQDGHAHPEHHDLQEMLHQRRPLRWGPARHPAAAGTLALG